MEKKISFSELKIWNECPFKHNLVYINGIGKFEGNEYTAFGTALHSVCEQKLPNPTVNEKEIFLKAFAEQINILKEKNIALREDILSPMEEQGLRICELVLPEVKKHFGEFEILSVEESLLEEITEFDSFGKKFKGFIDLVIQTPDKKIHIIDWKTCSWGWNFKRRTDPMTTYQLTYYKNFYAKKHNIDPANIETYFILLKRTAKKDIVEVIRVTSGPKKTNNSLNLLQKAVININKGNSIKNRLSCRYCQFYNTEHCP